MAQTPLLEKEGNVAVPLRPIRPSRNQPIPALSQPAHSGPLATKPFRPSRNPPIRLSRTNLFRPSHNRPIRVYFNQINFHFSAEGYSPPPHRIVSRSRQKFCSASSTTSAHRLTTRGSGGNGGIAAQSFLTREAVQTSLPAPADTSRKGHPGTPRILRCPHSPSQNHRSRTESSDLCKLRWPLRDARNARESDRHLRRSGGARTEFAPGGFHIPSCRPNGRTPARYRRAVCMSEPHPPRDARSHRKASQQC